MSSTIQSKKVGIKSYGTYTWHTDSIVKVRVLRIKCNLFSLFSERSLSRVCEKIWCLVDCQEILKRSRDWPIRRTRITITSPTIHVICVTRNETRGSLTMDGWLPYEIKIINSCVVGIDVSPVCSRILEKAIIFLKKITSHEQCSWSIPTRQGKRWLTPRSRHPFYLCQELGRLWGHPSTLSRRLPLLRHTFQKTSLLDMNSVFEFELLDRWSPKDTQTVWSVVKDASTVTTTNSSLTSPASRVSGHISMSNFQVKVSLLPRNK